MPPVVSKMVHYGMKIEDDFKKGKICEKALNVMEHLLRSPQKMKISLQIILIFMIIIVIIIIYIPNN